MLVSCWRVWEERIVEAAVNLSASVVCMCVVEKFWRGRYLASEPWAYQRPLQSINNRRRDTARQWASGQPVVLFVPIRANISGDHWTIARCTSHHTERRWKPHLFTMNVYFLKQ